MEEKNKGSKHANNSCCLCACEKCDQVLNSASEALKNRLKAERETFLLLLQRLRSQHVD
ncbi:Uncharacterised protein [Salmonella enterica subsp. enterica serovar Daytona]|uniref:Uncharacterized protein n=1 Tax=Salmonella enterica subsp. enterica serovar Daytona TaxID=1962639 RepID=A0A447JDV0_SALET|nr:Uncharacterised protein [Salmonella enterica subsp. enterica serovar Daytona]